MTQPTTKPASGDLESLAADIRLIVFDVDGVLTDGGLYYGPEGEALKRFDVKDGHAIVMARMVGLPCAVLTARTSQMVIQRGKELGLLCVYQGHKDKTNGLKQLLAEVGIAPENCAFMGDDLNDLGPMTMVRLGACPADAVLEVRQRATFVARNPGGRGAARELVELCLRASGKWEAALALHS